MLCGLLPEFPSAPEMTENIRKTHSSPLKHIFSTNPAFTPSSTQNWVCTRSGCPGVVVEKIQIRAQSSFPDFPSIRISLWDNRVPQKPGNSGVDMIAFQGWQRQ
jgi:hypothetical protein